MRLVDDRGDRVRLVGVDAIGEPGFDQRTVLTAGDHLARLVDLDGAARRHERVAPVICRRDLHGDLGHADAGRWRIGGTRGDIGSRRTRVAGCVQLLPAVAVERIVGRAAPAITGLVARRGGEHEVARGLPDATDRLGGREQDVRPARLAADAAQPVADRSANVEQLLVRGAPRARQAAPSWRSRRARSRRRWPRRRKTAPLRMNVVDTSPRSPRSSSRHEWICCSTLSRTMSSNAAIV